MKNKMLHIFEPGTAALPLPDANSYSSQSADLLTPVVVTASPLALHQPPAVTLEAIQLAGPKDLAKTINKNDPVVDSLTGRSLTANHQTFTFSDFTDTQNLQLNGSATQRDGTLQLTSNTHYQAGSTFFTRPVDLSAETSFSTQFQFQLNDSTSGADGFAFILQNSSAGSTALGEQGGSIGYDIREMGQGTRVDKSLAIEFDTYQNRWDINNNHISILKNGDVTTALATATEDLLDLNSGQLLTAWIDYNGSSNQLDISVASSDRKPLTTTLSYTVDLTAILGSQAFAGFSGGTGGLTNQQLIKNWAFSTENETPTFSTAQAQALSSETLATKAAANAQHPLEIITLPDQQAAPLIAPLSSSSTGTGLLAEYYNSLDFTNLALTRTDPTVNFYWNRSSPDPAVITDYFSARWTGKVQAQFTEDYTFYTTSDDGIRLWVNDTLLVDRFFDQGPTEYNGTLSLVAGQKYDIRMEYYEKRGGAVALLSWSSPSQSKQIIPQSQLFLPSSDPGITLQQTNDSTAVTEDGTTDTYSLFLDSQPTDDVIIAIAHPDSQTTTIPTTLTFTPQSWDRPQTITVTAIDDASREGFHSSTIIHTVSSDDAQYNGLTVAPVDIAIADNDTPPEISLQETAPLFTETYTFYTAATNSVRVWVNDMLLIDGLINQPPVAEYTATIELVAGQKYDIVTEQYDNGSGQIAQVEWSSPSQSRQAVPSYQPFLPQAPAPNPGVRLIQTDGSTDVKEGQIEDTYSLALVTQPAADVTITTAVNNNQTTTDLNTLTFTPQNWNQLQTITVTATDDDITEDSHNSAITHTVTSTDSQYNGQAIAPLTVTITDNDTPLPPTPRLFLDSNELNETRVAVTIPGSHHQIAFSAIKARVDQNDWRVYDENPNDNNWNYARAWHAREAAFVYLITGEETYAQNAYDTLYAIHNDPDPDRRLPESGRGLARAATGMGFALAYDWAGAGWTQAQKDYIRGKINTSLDAWPSYGHPNFADPYGSNWVAVSRGAELVMMLAAGEETNRADRFTNLKFWLREHLQTAYGSTGLTQEGQGYLAYAGGFLMPAVYALRSIGDSSLENAFSAIDFAQLPLYTGAFDAVQSSLQFGVAGIGFDAEGFTSFLLDSADPETQPYYQYFYDRHRGLENAAAPNDKFDYRRAGTVWSVLYYPTDTTALDPSDVLPAAIQDPEKGAYLFRDRWQDQNDILVSLMGDFTQHRRSWDQPEAFSLGLHTYDTLYFGGPIQSENASDYSKLIVDGKAGNRSLTGAPEFFEARANGGYAIVDGGALYADLGIDEAQRHLLVDFSGEAGGALLSTLDRLEDLESHIYTWQANLGTVGSDGGIVATAGQEGDVKTFLLSGNSNSYLKGWILNPSDAIVRAGDPLQIETTDNNADIWVVMLVGTGIAPTASVTGTGLESELQIGNAHVYFDAALNRIVTESL